MSGSHYDAAPEYGAYFSDAPTCPAPDLRTMAEREADELAALRVEVARLADALNYAHRRIDEQARGLAALRTAVVQHADALTVLNLRGGV